MEVPVLPASSEDVTRTPPTDDVAVRIQALEATPMPASTTLDEIREAQSADDSLQPVIQALKDQVRPPNRLK